ncbi:MAG: hypothetical protein ACR2GK_13450 [Gemmatimonadaceae bacterium]
MIVSALDEWDVGPLDFLFIENVGNLGRWSSTAIQRMPIFTRCGRDWETIETSARAGAGMTERIQRLGAGAAATVA